MINDIDLTNLPITQQRDLLELLEEFDKRLKYNKLETMFPDSGPYARGKYPKHIDFMQAGRFCKERGLFGANRSGKTVTLNFELACHLTGKYPSWWRGKVFHHPIKAWCASDTHNKVRDTAQYYLLGKSWELGTGFIPKDCIDKDSIRAKSNVQNAIASVRIKHHTDGRADGWSEVEFLSYEAGRAAFQGTQIDVCQLDEEPPSDVYSEALTRTIQTDLNKEPGILLFGFTPLNGLTPTVLRFLPNGRFPVGNMIPGESRGIWCVSWDDAPHIPESEKAVALSSYLPHEIEARTRGLPVIGSGKVYIVPENDFTIEPFKIPPHWPRFFGFDIPFFSGSAACVWFTHDTENDILYLYDCYKADKQLPVVHAGAITRRGKWIPGVIDPSAVRRNTEGIEFLRQYQDLGLDIITANNAVEAGIMAVTNRLSDGRIRIFNTCTQWLEEYRLYRLDKSGKIAKNQSDDLMDATRYAIMSGIDRAITKPDEESERENFLLGKARQYSRDNITGY